MAGASAGHMSKKTDRFNGQKLSGNTFQKISKDVGVHALSGRTMSKSAHAKRLTNAKSASKKRDEAMAKVRSAAAKQGVATKRANANGSNANNRGLAKARAETAKAKQASKRATATAKRANSALTNKAQSLVNANDKERARKAKK